MKAFARLPAGRPKGPLPPKPTRPPPSAEYLTQLASAICGLVAGRGGALNEAKLRAELASRLGSKAVNDGS